MFWLHLYAAVQPCLRQPSHSGPRVPAGTRSSLRPLSFEGEAMKQSSGKTSRETAKVCLRSGMRMDARPCHPQTPSLRAERRNPVYRRGKILECFAALAMTRMMEVYAAEIAK